MMKPYMTSLTFGAHTRGVASIASPAAYANPLLLMEAGQLLKVVFGAKSSATGNNHVETLVVDVRPECAFEKGHIRGAINLNPNAVIAEQGLVSGSLRPVAELENLLSKLGVTANRRIVFYDNRGGFNAARMLWLMEYLGHQNVAILNGGLAGWRAAGGTMSMDVTMPVSTAFKAVPDSQRYASVGDVLGHADSSQGVLVDVRPHKMYDEGHIPWAINVPWSMNLDANNRFLEADRLMAHFKHHGVTPEHDVILYCQAGLASPHSYVALRLLGFPRVRIYHGSWVQWSSDPTLPKVNA